MTQETNPRTPVKWINYVGTIAFGGFLDHTGGSQLYRDDRFECPVGMYYTRWVTEMAGLRFEIFAFVPRGGIHTIEAVMGK